GNPKLDPVMGAYPMPSHHPGKMMPTLLGGSDLAIPVTSQNKGLARDWINDFTSTKNQRTLIKETGWVPNTTKLISVLKTNPKAAPFAKAAASSFGAAGGQLGQRRERQHPAEHARVDHDRSLEHQERHDASERSDHEHPQREDVISRPGSAKLEA